jgi:hypothetical protein
MKMKTKLFLSLAIGSLVFVTARAGSLEPPPGPVSPTRPPDKCFDNTGNRFVDCGNGTVKDTVRGLFWLKNANCFGLQDWATANIKAAELGHGQCGLTDGSLPGDWRLPTLNCAASSCSPIHTDTGEFASIFGPACTTAPYVLNTAGTGCWTAGNPFSGVQSNYYWSSTANVDFPDLAWYVYLYYGYVNYHGKNGPDYVWPVRGGP